MKTKRIDSLTGIDVFRLTFDDVQVKYGTHRCELSGNGRNKIKSSRSGYQTEIGDIESELWVRLAEQMVIQAGEEDILKRLITYVGSYPWNKNKSAASLRVEALELHISRIFDNPAWVGFIPFNEPWRPGVLAGADIIEVIPSCCQKPGRVTEQQIFNRGDGLTIPCPHCGRFAAFKRMQAEDK